MSEPGYIAVDEIGNDNFATSIYENDYKGLLIARCNQNGQYPEQTAALMRALNSNLSRPATDVDEPRWGSKTHNDHPHLQ